MKKRSWKTTMGGILAAIGQALQTTDSLGVWGRPTGQMLTILGLAILGLGARDNNVSSEEAGIK